MTYPDVPYIKALRKELAATGGRLALAGANERRLKAEMKQVFSERDRADDEVTRLRRELAGFDTPAQRGAKDLADDLRALLVAAIGEAGAIDGDVILAARRAGMEVADSAQTGAAEHGASRFISAVCDALLLAGPVVPSPPEE